MFANDWKICNSIGYMGRILLISVCTGFLLSACATSKSVPSNFTYETSLRGEQGLFGKVTRLKSAQNLLGKGAVKDPKTTLEAALPNQNIKIQKWGLRYFETDWTRYQILLEADVGKGKSKIKCREVSTEGPVGAPVLKELLANDGALFQAELDDLVAACLKDVATPPP